MANSGTGNRDSGSVTPGSAALQCLPSRCALRQAALQSWTTILLGPASNVTSMKTSHVLVLALLAHAVGTSAQDVAPKPDPATVFRADAYILNTSILLKWGRGAPIFKPASPDSGKPIEGLTSEAFRVEIDEGVVVAAIVVPDRDTPGLYNVAFSPPDSLRDGKKHNVEISIPGMPPSATGKTWIPRIRQQFKFEKPRPPSN